jgi:hypothetical protein
VFEKKQEKLKRRREQFEQEEQMAKKAAVEELAADIGVVFRLQRATEDNYCRAEFHDTHGCFSTLDKAVARLDTLPNPHLWMVIRLTTSQMNPATRTDVLKKLDNMN